MQSISLRIATTHGLIWRGVRVPRVGSARLGPPPPSAGTWLLSSRSRGWEKGPHLPVSPAYLLEKLQLIRRFTSRSKGPSPAFRPKPQKCAQDRKVVARTDLRAASRTLGPWVCPPGPRRRGRSPAPPTLCQPLPPAGAALLPVCFSAALLGFWGRGLPRATHPPLWSCVTLTSWETHSGGVWLVP